MSATKEDIYDVIVVGLGIHGCSSLYNLAQCGKKVLGLEQFAELAHKMGSSHGESRIFRLAYSRDTYFQMLLRSSELWYQLESKWQDFSPENANVRLIYPVGCLVIGPSDVPLVEGTLRAVKKHGIDHAVLTAEQVQQKFPEFHLDSSDVAIFEPNAGYIDPEHSLEAYVRLAQSLGARVTFQAKVIGWHRHADGIIQVLTDGDKSYFCRKLVLSGGAWASQLFAAEIDLPLTINKSFCFWFHPLQGLSPFSNSPTYIWACNDRLHSIYGFPRHPNRPESAKIGGGPLEDLIPGGYPTPESVDRQWKEEHLLRMRALIATKIPLLNGTLDHGETCLTTKTPSGNFLIAPHPKDNDVLLVSACSGHGFKFAPAIGEIVAQLCDDRTPRYDLTMFTIEALKDSPITL